jgi:hypothetical protein
MLIKKGFIEGVKEGVQFGNEMNNLHSLSGGYKENVHVPALAGKASSDQAPPMKGIEYEPGNKPKKQVEYEPDSKPVNKPVGGFKRPNRQGQQHMPKAWQE